MFAALNRVLGRWRRRRAVRDSEHGAVAAIVAVVLGGGVLMGSGAMVVDVGLLYANREQLQSGADAASFKIAMNCAKNVAVCTTGAQSTVAVTYAKKNADNGQGAAQIQICLANTVCPTTTWNTGQTCRPMPTPPAATTVGSYVEVRTTTLQANGSNLVPPVFAGALPGMAGYQGSQVGSCARVNWGPPADPGRVFSMGVSYCDWNRMTNPLITPNAGFFAPLANLISQVGLYSVAGLTPPTAGVDQAITAVLPATVLNVPLPSCATPLNLSVPRGYTWLNSTDGTVADGSCSIDVAVGDHPKSTILSGLTVGASNACSSRLQAARTRGLPILIPIFDALQQTVLTLAPGYHIVGFAPFVVTGFTNLLGGLVSAATSLLSSGSLCSLLGNCVYGYFTKALVPESHPTFGTGTNFGATIIGRTG